VSQRRVVITGMGVVSPLGEGVEHVFERMSRGESGVSILSELQTKHGFDTCLAGVIPDFDASKMERSKRRSMSRVSLLAVRSVERALADAKLEQNDISNQQTGVSFASTMGGTSAIQEIFMSAGMEGKFTQGVMSTSFLKMMSHTCAANVAIYFNVPGRVVASCTACAASTQSIGFGYEAIRDGQAEKMICGGAEEFHAVMAGVFDTLRSTSRKYNDTPSLTPRPFDKDRDGIVVGEGAGCLILEEYSAAKARGAKIYGEIIGYATNNDANHMTNPSPEGLEHCMRAALKNAKVEPEKIDYINAHGTGTLLGDAAEAKAIGNIFGNKAKLSSLKGHFGHLMGSCGVIETALTVEMMNRDTAIPTLNLQNPDPNCGELDFIMGETRNVKMDMFLKNSFAFGGINASLVIKRV